VTVSLAAWAGRAFYQSSSWVLGSYQERCTQDWCTRSMAFANTIWNHIVPWCAEWRGETETQATTVVVQAVVQSRLFSLFGHIAQMPGETDAKKIFKASPVENWRKPPGCPRTAWMKTIQQDLKSNNLSLNEAIEVAQNRPLWRLMFTFGTTHS